MQKNVVFTLLLLFFSEWISGQSIVERPIVLQVPGMAEVTSQPHRISHEGNNLNFVLYLPSDYKKGQILPTVIFANGGIEALPNWRVYQDWARLMAAHGFIAVLHQSSWEERYEELGRVLDFLYQNGTSIGVDGQRMGVWACSGNVTAAYPQLMDEKRSYLKAAVFYYGMPLEFTPPRQSLPLQLVRAGLDTYSLNSKIAKFVEQALTIDIPLEFINYLEGYHAFDILNDTPHSRQIIRQTVRFFEQHLSNEELQKNFVLTGTNFYEMIIQGQWEEAGALMKSAFEADVAAGRPYNGYYRVAEENNINGIGYQLISEGHTKEAVFVMLLNNELFPESANTYDSLADAYEANGEKAKALEWAHKTLALIEKTDSINDRQKELLRKSAEDKIKRLE